MGGQKFGQICMGFEFLGFLVSHMAFFGPDSQNRTGGWNSEKLIGKGGWMSFFSLNLKGIYIFYDRLKSSKFFLSVRACEF